MNPADSVALMPLARFDAGLVSAVPGRTTKTQDAAQQFEALLLTQILQSAHDPDGGWLGGSDSSGSCAAGYAEQRLAAALAQQGGLGLAKMIAAGLEQVDRSNSGT